MRWWISGGSAGCYVVSVPVAAVFAGLGMSPAQYAFVEQVWAQPFFGLLELAGTHVDLWLPGVLVNALLVFCLVWVLRARIERAREQRELEEGTSEHQ